MRSYKVSTFSGCIHNSHLNDLLKIIKKFMKFKCRCVDGDPGATTRLHREKLQAPYRKTETTKLIISLLSARKQRLDVKKGSEYCLPTQNEFIGSVKLSTDLACFKDVLNHPSSKTRPSERRRNSRES